MAELQTEERGEETGVKPAGATADKRLLPFLQAAERRGAPAPAAPDETPPAPTPPTETPPAPPASETPTETPPAPSGDAEAPETPPTDPAMAPTWADLQRRDREVRQRETAQSQDKRDAAELRRLRTLHAQDPMAAVAGLAGQDPQTAQGHLLDIILSKQGGGETDLVGMVRSLQEEVRALKTGTQQAVQVATNAKVESREQARIRQHIEASESEMVKLAASVSDEAVDEIINEAAAEFDRAGQPRGWRPNYPDLVQRLEGRYTADALALTQNLLKAKVVRDKVMEWLKLSPPPPGQPTPPPAQATAPPAGTRKPPVTLDNSLQEETAPQTKKRLATLDEKREAFLGHIRGAHEKAREKERNR